RPRRGGALVDGEDEFFLTHTDSCVEVVRCDRTQMNAWEARPAMMAPTSGPKTGTHEYAQSEPPLFGIGSSEWTMRGPRSRAGLMAHPVGPASEASRATTMGATASGPSLSGVPPKTRMTKTSTKVATISVMKFQPKERISGPVEKVPRMLPGSSSSS